MTQEEFKKLKVGDKVRIVSDKKGNKWNNDGKMDKWIGKVMTILDIIGNCCYARMEEDKKEWAWYPEIIACKVDEKQTLEDIANGLSNEELARLKELIENKQKKPDWLIKKGENYCVVDYYNGGIECYKNNGDKTDKALNSYAIITRTETEAKERVKAIKMRNEYERWCKEYPVDWSNKEQEKYFAWYDLDENKVFIEFDYTAMCQGTIYCSNKEHLQAFIDKVTEPEFRKYVLGVGLPERCFLEV